MKYAQTVLYLTLSCVAFSQKEIKIFLQPEVSVIDVPVFMGKASETRTGYFSMKNLFFQITLIDNNNNKRFNDLDKDVINIEYQKVKRIRLHLGVSNTKIKETNYIETEERIFKIVDIDPLSNYLKIKEIKSLPNNVADNVVKLVDRLPDLDFKKIDNSILNFRNFTNKEKYIFVEFWGTWCKGCIKILPQLKNIYAKYKDKLTVIYLNSRDDKQKVKLFVEKSQLNWINGFSNQQIEEEMLLGRYPYGVLFDQKGKIIKFQCDLLFLEEFLSQIEKND